MSFGDDHLADCGIGMTVSSRISKAHRAAIGQANPRRSLDLCKEQFDGIGKIENFELLFCQSTVLNGGAVEIGNEAVRCLPGG